jgi:hypothetical protein
MSISRRNGRPFGFGFWIRANCADAHSFAALKLLLQRFSSYIQ